MRALSAEGDLSIRAIVGTSLVAEAARRHRTAPTATAALGRALMGAILLASGSSPEERVQLEFRGDGPLGGLTAIADGSARARGYVSRPGTHPPPREGKLDVARAVGSGLLGVVRSHPSRREPYRGVVPLTSGEIAEDLARYLDRSEQTASAVGLGVYVAADGSVEAAGGFLVQALPGASKTSLERLERNVREAPSPTGMLRSGLDADGLVDTLFHGVGTRGRHSTQPRFYCGCGRDRVLRALTLLGRSEVREAAATGETLEVRCEFCGESYSVEPDEVGALLPDA
ncbi:MAG: Hsp33 family molecular chaperone HslO [Myxococcota bacterium]